jgi:hypothetical protein
MGEGELLLETVEGGLEAAEAWVRGVLLPRRQAENAAARAYRCLKGASDCLVLTPLVAGAVPAGLEAPTGLSVAARRYERLSEREVRPGEAGSIHIVMAEVPAEIEDDYNAYYDREHLRDLLQIEGYLRASRWRQAAEPRYLVIYELVAPHTLTEEERRRLQASAWSQRLNVSRFTRRVAEYERIGEAGTR